MSDRDRGDSPDGTPDASLSASAEATPRARTTSRGRRRSLRVPVDEVPRRAPASEGGVSGETALDDQEPLSSESTVIGAEPPAPSVLLPPASSETLASSEDLAFELDDDASMPDMPPELELEPELEAASREMEGTFDLAELEAEPTRVAPRSAPPPPGALAALAPAALAAMAPTAVAPVAMDGSLTTPRRPSSVPPPSALGFTVPKIPASPLPSSPPIAAATEAPAADALATDALATDALATDALAADAPAADAPAADASAADAPAAEPPLTEPPLAEPPLAEPPLAEAGPDADPAARPSRPERMSSPPPGAAAVVVARTVRVTSPPPPPAPGPATAEASSAERAAGEPAAPETAAAAPAEPAAAASAPETDELTSDEPEISFGDEPLDELQIDFGDEDDAEEPLESRMTDPSVGSAPTGEVHDDAEVEVADLADSELDEPAAAPMPPPPPRESARSQPNMAAVAAEPVRAPTEEEELAADELAADELEVAEVAKPGSMPPPRPEKQAPPPHKAAPPIPAAKPVEKPVEKPAEKPAEASPDAAAAAEARRARKKANWWEDFFNDDYLRTVPPPNPRQIARQCDFIEGRLKLKPGSTILDVGCGLGLHAIELTRRGYLVVGLDLSLPMLSRAADEAQDEGFRINFLHADMREMNFEGAFDAVLCIGTTFGYFDDDQNRALVERLYRALKPKGVLLLDVVNRDFVFKSQPNLVWFEGDGCVVMEETSANYITSRLHVKRTVILDDGRQRDNNYSVRLYALHELGQILHHRGFRVGEVSGREATPGVFFGADSPRLIIVAERRPQQTAPPTPPGKKAEGADASPSAPSAPMGDAPADPTAPAEPTAPGSTAAPGSTEDGEPPSSN